MAAPAAPGLGPRLRAAVPGLFVPALAATRARVDWRRGAAQDDARAQMRFVVEHTRPDLDLDTVARAYVRYQARRGELRWHPHLLTHLRVVGLDHLLAAQAERRGVVLNFMHHGYYDGAFPSIARSGPRSKMVVHPYMVEPDAPRWLKQHVHVATRNGGVAVSAAVGVDGMLAMLAEGDIVALASDVPGRTPVRFLGRDLVGSFGAARVAATADAPVVVMTSEEDAEGPFIRLHEPLAPTDAESPQALFQTMLDRHEPVVVRWPEAADLPLSRWGVPEDPTS